MVSLEKSKLIRLNSDGSNADVFQTKRSSIKFGTSVLCDYIINNELNQYPELLYEISSDTFSRIIITNKCDVPISINGDPVIKRRPIFNNCIITIADDIKFRWINAGEESKTKEAEYPGWSDPGKKNSAVSRFPPGRFTAHALHFYSSNSSLEDASVLNESKSSGVHSFIDQNDENQISNEIPKCLKNDENLTLSETPKKMSTHRKPISDESKLASLSYSFSTVTSYVSTNEFSNVHENNDIFGAPIAHFDMAANNFESPSKTAFQPIDQNDNNKSKSFAVVKPPTTPLSAKSIVNKSVHLIDFIITPIQRSLATEPISRGQSMLKSALKNSTLKSKSDETPSTSKDNIIASTPYMVPKRIFDNTANDNSIINETDYLENEKTLEMATQLTLNETFDANKTLKIDNLTNEVSQIVEHKNETKCPKFNSKNDAESADEQESSESDVKKLNELQKDAKSSNISNLINLSNEEEDELLNRDDAEIKGPFNELSEDVLLAGSSDDETLNSRPKSENVANGNSNESQANILNALNEIAANLNDMSNVSEKFDEICKTESVIENTEFQSVATDAMAEQIESTSNPTKIEEFILISSQETQPSIIDLCSTVGEISSQRSVSEPLSQISEPDDDNEHIENINNSLNNSKNLNTVDSTNLNIEISQCNSNTEHLNAMDRSEDILGDIDEKIFNITSTCISSTQNKLNESDVEQDRVDSTITDDDIYEKVNQNKDDEVHSTIESNNENEVDSDNMIAAAQEETSLNLSDDRMSSLCVSHSSNEYENYSIEEVFDNSTKTDANDGSEVSKKRKSHAELDVIVEEIVETEPQKDLEIEDQRNKEIVSDEAVSKEITMEETKSISEDSDVRADDPLNKINTDSSSPDCKQQDENGTDVEHKVDETDSNNESTVAEDENISGYVQQIVESNEQNEISTVEQSVQLSSCHQLSSTEGFDEDSEASNNGNIQYQISEETISNDKVIQDIEETTDMGESLQPAIQMDDNQLGPGQVVDELDIKEVVSSTELQNILSDENEENRSSLDDVDHSKVHNQSSENIEELQAQVSIEGAFEQKKDICISPEEVQEASYLESPQQTKKIVNETNEIENEQQSKENEQNVVDQHTEVITVEDNVVVGIAEEEEEAESALNDMNISRLSATSKEENTSPKTEECDVHSINSELPNTTEEIVIENEENEMPCSRALQNETQIKCQVGQAQAETHIEIEQEVTHTEDIQQEILKETHVDGIVSKDVQVKPHIGYLQEDTSGDNIQERIREETHVENVETRSEDLQKVDDTEDFQKKTTGKKVQIKSRTANASAPPIEDTVVAKTPRNIPKKNNIGELTQSVRTPRQRNTPARYLEFETPTAVLRTPRRTVKVKENVQAIQEKIEVTNVAISNESTAEEPSSVPEKIKTKKSGSTKPKRASREHKTAVEEQTKEKVGGKKNDGKEEIESAENVPPQKPIRKRASRKESIDIQHSDKNEKAPTISEKSETRVIEFAKPKRGKIAETINTSEEKEATIPEKKSTKRVRGRKQEISDESSVIEEDSSNKKKIKHSHDEKEQSVKNINESNSSTDSKRTRPKRGQNIENVQGQEDAKPKRKRLAPLEAMEEVESISVPIKRSNRRKKNNVEDSTTEVIEIFNSYQDESEHSSKARRNQSTSDSSTKSESTESTPLKRNISKRGRAKLKEYVDIVVTENTQTGQIESSSEGEKKRNVIKPKRGRATKQVQTESKPEAKSEPEPELQKKSRTRGRKKNNNDEPEEDKSLSPVKIKTTRTKKATAKTNETLEAIAETPSKLDEPQTVQPKVPAQRTRKRAQNKVEIVDKEEPVTLKRPTRQAATISEQKEIRTRSTRSSKK